MRTGRLQEMLLKLMLAFAAVPLLALAPAPIGAMRAEAATTVYFNAGTNVTGMWSSKTKELSFYGKTGTAGGKLADASGSNNPAWKSYRLLAEKIIIGEGVTGISSYAFRDFINLNKVTIAYANLTEIGDYAFYGCTYLTTVESKSGAKITRIGEGAFRKCTLLNSASFPTNLSTLGPHAFQECTELTEIDIRNVEDISDYAFSGCKKLVSVRCSPNLKRIGKFAFFDDKRLSKFNDGKQSSRAFEIPMGCALIDYKAFFMEDINYYGAPSIYINGAYDNEGKAIGVIGDYAFSLKDYGLSGIPNDPIASMFNDLDHVADYVVGDGVKEIGSCALTNGYLRKLGKDVEMIGDYAFYGGACMARGKDDKYYYLDFVIPKSVKKIGDHAFENFGVRSLEFEMESNGTSALEEIGDYAFAARYDNKNPLGIFNDPEGVYPDGVILYFPKNLKRIGKGAFYNAQRLTGISFMEWGDDADGTDPSIEVIDREAFSYCDLSDRVDYLPESLKRIEYAAFANTHMTGTLNLEHTSLEKIASCAFYTDWEHTSGPGHRNNITAVRFPKTLRTIEDYAFQNAYYLRKLYFKGGNDSQLETIANEAFYKKQGDPLELFGLENTHIRKIGNRAFWALNMDNLTLGNSLVEIGERAISGNVKNLTIPGSLTTIPSGAITAELWSVTIKEGVKVIEEKAFSFDSRGPEVVSIYLPNTIESCGPMNSRGQNKFVAISVPATIKNLDFLPFSWNDQGQIITKNGCAIYRDVEFRGTEAQLEALSPGKTFAEINSDYESVFYGIYDPSDGYSCSFRCLAASEINSGKCGETLSWEYNPNNKRLTISGYGDMRNYGAAIGADEAPWHDKEVTQLVFDITAEGHGLTIGSHAFSGANFKALNVAIPQNKVDYIIINTGAFQGSGIQTIDFGLSAGKALLMGDDVFEGSDLQSFSNSGTIRGIGKRALSNTKLTAINIHGDDYEIGEEAFSDCGSLTTVTISDITELSPGIFSGCSSLQTVTLNDVTALDEGVFSGCDSIATINIPKVTAVCDNAFSGLATLTTVDITGAVTIGKKAFFSCTGLITVKVTPDKLTSIGDQAFMYCYNLCCSDRKDGYDNYRYPLYQQANLKKIGQWAFYDCRNGFEKINFPGISLIEDNAFGECDYLTTVTLKGQGSIGNNVFNGCGALTTVNLEGIKKIGYGTFFQCSNLTSFTADTGLEQIGPEAFRGCQSLASFTIPSGVRTIDRDVFHDCTGLTTVTVADRSDPLSIGAYAFYGCTELQTVDNSEKITSLGDGAFYGCTKLLDYTLSPSCEEIPLRLFSGSGLKRVKIPAGVKKIGPEAFDIAVPESVVFYGTIDQWRKVDIDFTKYGTSNGNDCLKKVVIACSDGKCGYTLDMQYHNDDLFWSLDNEGTLEIHGTGDMRLTDMHSTDLTPWKDDEGSIKNVVIGGEEEDEVQYVDTEAFKGLANLETVTLSLSEERGDVGQEAFAGCPKLSSVTVNSGRSIGESAFEGCTALTDVEITMTSDDYHITQEIKGSAFKGCTKLESVTIADGMEKIGESAFSGCTALTGIEIPNSVYWIGAGAFTGCGGTDGITISDWGSSGVTSYFEGLSDEEKQKTGREDLVATAVAGRDKGVFTADLTTQNKSLTADETTLLLNTLNVLAGYQDVYLHESAQGILVDFDHDDPYMTSTWSEADDILISIGADGGSVISPLEKDDYLDEYNDQDGYYNHPYGFNSQFKFATANKEYYSGIHIKFPATASAADCAVTFDANGGSGEMDGVTVRKDTWYTLPICTFTPPGYKVFDRWDKGTNGDPEEHVLITGDTVIKAVWREHDHELGYIEEKKPDCRSDGNHSCYLCGICGKYFSDSEGKNEVKSEDVYLAADPGAHVFEYWIVDTPPTDTQEGSKHCICSICGYRQDKAIPVTTHVHDFKFHAEVPASCVTTGTKAYYECTDCGYKFLDNTDESSEVNGETMLRIPVDIDAHDFDAGTVTKDPTCLEDGVKTFTCKNNAHHKRTEPVAALGHDWGEWQTVTEATETTDGKKQRTCKRAGCGVTEEEIIKAAGEELTKNLLTPAPVVVTETVGEVLVSAQVSVYYPEAVHWTGKKTTKGQLQALAKEKGKTPVAITFTGIQEALKTMKAGYDPAKLVTLDYKISGEKKVGDKPYFTITAKVNKNGVKKAKLSKKDKKALSALVKNINAELRKEANRHSFEIAPINLDDAALIKSITVKATLKSKKVQGNEDGTLKKVKSLTVKASVPGIAKPVTFTYKKSKATNAFTIMVTGDPAEKKVSITPRATNTGFTGSRADITVRK